MKTKFILAVLVAGQLAWAQNPEPDTTVAISDEWRVDLSQVDNFDWNTLQRSSGEAIYLSVPSGGLDLSLPADSGSFPLRTVTDEELADYDINTDNVFQFNNDSGGIEGAVRSLRARYGNGVGVNGFRVNIRRLERSEHEFRIPGMRRPPRPWMLTLERKF